MSSCIIESIFGQVVSTADLSDQVVLDWNPVGDGTPLITAHSASLSAVHCLDMNKIRL